MRKMNHHRLGLEQLEDRLTPAFDAVFNPAVDTWTLTQVADDGAATIGINGAGSITVDDGAGATQMIALAGSNLTIIMLNNSSDTLTVDLDTALTGDLTMRLGNGSRDINFTGTANSIGGNLRINAGTDLQRLELALNAPLVVGGSANIDMGIGTETVPPFGDSVVFSNSVTVGSDLMMRGVNFFNDFLNNQTVSLVVGRHFSNIVSSQNANSGTFLDDMFLLAIGGNVTYIGSNAPDELTSSGNITSVIGGSVYMNAGTNVIEANTPDILDVIGTTIGGNVTFISGLNTGAMPDTFASNAFTVIGGNIYVNMGDGDNTATFLGEFGGSALSYQGGIGVDSVTYGMTGNRARIFAALSQGDDDFILNSIATTSVGFLFIDFGFGSDDWTNNFGAPFSFPTILRNLP